MTFSSIILRLLFEALNSIMPGEIPKDYYDIGFINSKRW